MAKNKLSSKPTPVETTAVDTVTNVPEDSVVNDIVEDTQALAVAGTDYASALLDVNNTDNDVFVESPAWLNSPYVAWAHPMSKNAWARITRHFENVEESDPYLMVPEPSKPIQLDPFRFFLICAQQYYFSEDTNGKVIKCSLTKTTELSKEMIEAIVFVYLEREEQIVPARCQFKKARCPAVHACTGALKIAKTSEWGSLSAEHKQTLVIPDARFRFVTTCRMVPKPEKKYVVVNGVTRPIASSIWELLQESIASEEFKKTLDAVGESYNRRKEELTKLM